MDCHGLRPRNDPLRVKSTGTSGATFVIARSEATRRSLQAGRQSRIASFTHPQSVIYDAFGRPRRSGDRYCCK